MSEPAASPRLIKFVRRALRHEPDLRFEALLERWRVQAQGEADEEMVRRVYAEEVAASAELAVPERYRTRLLVGTAVVWILVNAGLALLIGLQGYVDCRAGAPTGGGLFSCGLNLGLVFLVVGIAQVVYGAIFSVIALRIRKPVAQGILIGMGAALVLFTAVCFGATARG